MPDRIVAIGLLTQRDVDVLGQGFRRAFPVGHLDDFASLLRAIDEAERRSEDSDPIVRAEPPVADRC